MERPWPTRTSGGDGGSDGRHGEDDEGIDAHATITPPPLPQPPVGPPTRKPGRPGRTSSPSSSSARPDNYSPAFSRGGLDINGQPGPEGIGRTPRFASRGCGGSRASHHHRNFPSRSSSSRGGPRPSSAASLNSSPRPSDPTRGSTPCEEEEGMSVRELEEVARKVVDDVDILAAAKWVVGLLERMDGRKQWEGTEQVERSIERYVMFVDLQRHFPYELLLPPDDIEGMQ